jgi:hypothetical protein
MFIARGNARGIHQEEFFSPTFDGSALIFATKEPGTHPVALSCLLPFAFCFRSLFCVICG